MDTVAEFQSRRMETWRRVRLSLAVMAVGFVYLLFGCAGADSNLCIVAFAAVAVAIGHAAFTWKRYYRCPACEEPVRDSEGSVPLNPKTCFNCGAKLK
jgi:hypothetical protein